MSLPQRRFNSEVSTLIDKNVIVMTINKNTFSGTLIGLNPDNMNLVLADAKDPDGKSVPRIILNGDRVVSIISIEKKFDLASLAERLERLFPRLVKLYEKEGFIWVMDRVKVTEEGVVEGSGPAAERVERVHAQFIREMKGE